MGQARQTSTTFYRISVAIAWSVIAVVLAIAVHMEFSRLEHEALRIARERGRTLFQLIQTTREWNARHGGVYVPVGPLAEPNPYLKVPDRDIVTLDGKRLTLINPAYMTRQIADLTQRGGGATIHITSLVPIRPGNAPDDWERIALQAFERGTPEFLEAMTLDGKPVHRYMAPLMVDKVCLKCHEAQGYRVGDVRGGISVTMPAVQAEASVAESRATTLATAALAFVVLGGLSHRMLYRNRRMVQRLSTLARHQEQEIEQRTSELERERSRYQAMAELSSDWFWEQDEHFRFVRFSGDHYHKGGLPTDQLIGHTRWEVPLIGVSDEALAAHRATLEAHQPFEGFEYQILNRQGELRWYRASGQPQFARDGRFLGYVGTGLDVTARKRREQMLRTLTEDTATVSGPAFFDVLVTRLRGALDVRYCYAARAEPGGTIRTIALADGLGERQSLEYGLAGTPCARVMAGHLTVHPEGVRIAFPAAGILAELAAESYIGVPIQGATGRPMGVLAAVDTRPIRIERDLNELMRIFAARAALEFERMDGERALRESERLLKQAEQIAGVGSWEMDFSDHSLTWSEETYHMFAVDRRSFDSSYEGFLARVHPADRPLVDATFQAAVRDHLPYEVEHRILLPDGGERTVLERGEILYGDDGRPRRAQGMVQDVTLRRAAEEQLRLAARVFSATHDGVAITDTAGNIVDVNPALCRQSGYTRQELLGHNPRIFMSGRHDRRFFEQLWSDLHARGHWEGEIWNRRKDGSVAPERVSITAVRDDNGRVIHYIGVYTDISSLKAQQQRLEQEAHHDALTGLPNRRLLLDRLRQAIAQSERSRLTLAVAFIDLDDFKPVNDRFGHDAGDLLLQEVARRLSHAVRGGDTVARLGGDEFVLALVGVHHLREIEDTLRRVLDDIRRPYLVADQQVTVGASIGVAVYPDDGGDPEVLLQHADIAMYECKHEGRNGYRLYRGMSD